MPKAYAWKSGENPNLLLWSKSLISNNKPLYNHLLNNFARGWTGELVTNKNWENIWLAEGFSTFIERKMIKSIYGEDLFNLTVYNGNKDLYKYIVEMGKNNNITSLHPNLFKVNPDIAVNVVAKEKGFQFLYYLENLAGESNFNAIIRNYILTYSNRSADYMDFKNVFEVSVSNYFSLNKADQILKSVDWESWINKPGFPIIKIEIKSSLAEKASKLVDAFLYNQEDELYKILLEEFKTWDYNTILLFLDMLHEKKNLINHNIYTNLKEKLCLLESENSEILYSWLYLSLKLRENDFFPELNIFLSNHGRYDYLINLYKEYYIMDKFGAMNCFNSNKAFYHPIIIEELANYFKEIENK